MVKHSIKLSSKQTYAIAHSAQCKLNMAADAPDRNLRFVLGHAFTLDSALYRVAEIEDLSEIEPGMAKKALENGNDDIEAQKDGTTEGQKGSLAGGTVIFDGDGNGGRIQPRPKKRPELGRRAAKLSQMPVIGTEDELDGDEEIDSSQKVEDGEDVENVEDEPVVSDEAYSDDDASDDGLGLTRYASASAAPPKMVPSGDSDSDEEDEEPDTPPSLPADVDCQTLVKGDTNEELGDLYESMRCCSCHGKSDVKSHGMWEVKDPKPAGGYTPGKRLAVMRVDA